MSQTAEFYLCPNCLNPGVRAGECEVCGSIMLHCRPGDPDDPCRRPVIDSKGRVQTRAPLWWLQKNIPDLARYYKDE